MSEETTTRQPSRNAFLVPIAIVLSAALIAGAIIYSGGKRGSTPIQVGNNPQQQQQTKDIEIAPVTEADHIYGNPNAP